MSTPDHHADAGEQWREDLPGDWEECLSDPPLATVRTDELNVVTQGDATVFQLEGHATCWIQAGNDAVYPPEECR